MNEKVQRFGDKESLFGVLTLPEHGQLSPDRPMIVILNAGLVHHVGPFRMNVPLSRRLASLGFGVFRMDQSGLGDSGTIPGGASFEQRSVADAKSAFDWLAQRHGARSFIVIGLCTGAMNAHRVALADPRVAAACLLDGYAYKTKQAEVRRLAPKVLDPKVWSRLFDRGANLIAARFPSLPLLERANPVGKSAVSSELPWVEGAGVFEQDWPTLPAVRAELEKILARGTKMLFVYSGGWSNFVHAGQFDEMFPHLPKRSQIDVRYFPEADHTYLERAHREALYDCITSWLATLKLRPSV